MDKFLLILFVVPYGAPILVAVALHAMNWCKQRFGRRLHKFEVVDINYLELDQRKVDEKIRYLDPDRSKKH
jgi:hypothetical protein